MREILPLAANNPVLCLEYLIFYSVKVGTNHNTTPILCQVRYYTAVIIA
jgi:hypothetical protein